MASFVADGIRPFSLSGAAVVILKQKVSSIVLSSFTNTSKCSLPRRVSSYKGMQTKNLLGTW